MNVKDPNSRLMRWRLKLEEFEYEIVTSREKQIQTLMLFHEFRLTRSTHMLQMKTFNMLSDLVKTKLIKI